MNGKIVRKGRFWRVYLERLILHYKSPAKRQKISVVKTWDELVALAAQKNPPPKIILQGEGKKITVKINKTPKKGRPWTFSIIATS